MVAIFIASIFFFFPIIINTIICLVDLFLIPGMARKLNEAYEQKQTAKMTALATSIVDSFKENSK